MNTRLGSNPLTQRSKGIFEKTADDDELEIEKPPKLEIKQKSEYGSQNTEARIRNMEAGIQKDESVKQNLYSGNQKQEIDDVQYDKVTVCLPVELNDWLDDLIHKTKRIHGSRMYKAELVQLALLMLRHQNIDPMNVNSFESLKSLLQQRQLIK